MRRSDTTLESRSLHPFAMIILQKPSCSLRIEGVVVVKYSIKLFPDIRCKSKNNKKRKKENDNNLEIAMQLRRDIIIHPL